MPPACYDKAVQLLAARPHFRRELEGKLVRRRYPPEEIAAVLNRLAGQGYLNDGETARAFVEGRQARGAEGRLRLKAELAKRGAAGETIEAALAGMSPGDELAAAREAAARWARGGKSDPQALARHLQRKGFPPRVIVAVLQERPQGSSAADLWDLNEDDSA